jgi:hypothetical protein
MRDKDMQNSRSTDFTTHLRNAAGIATGAKAPFFAARNAALKGRSSTGCLKRISSAGCAKRIYEMTSQSCAPNKRGCAVSLLANEPLS